MEHSGKQNPKIGFKSPRAPSCVGRSKRLCEKGCTIALRGMQRTSQPYISSLLALRLKDGFSTVLASR